MSASLEDDEELLDASLKLSTVAPLPNQASATQTKTAATKTPATKRGPAADDSHSGQYAQTKTVEMKKDPTFA